MRSGLDGVVVAETVLSHVDGDRGRLWVRGRTLAEIAAAGFEATVALLWDGFAGNGLNRAGIAADFAAGRELAFERLGLWLPAAAGRPLAEGVRLGVAALPEDSTPAAIAASLPVAVAALLRAQRGDKPVAPDPRLDTAADLLRMIAGAAVEERLGRALGTYFAAVVENGVNASSFAARVIASTRASLASAVLGGWCAFTGPLHGGAPGPTLEMLDDAAASGDIDTWLERKLSSGGRLMGFGHRVFPTRDPRAEILRAALVELGRDRGRLAFAEEVERRALAALARHRPGRPLHPNVEINAALLLDAVGLPRDAFTPVFAVARCPGWIAHALEQQQTGRYIRPASTYVGPAPTS